MRKLLWFIVALTFFLLTVPVVAHGTRLLPNIPNTYSTDRPGYNVLGHPQKCDSRFFISEDITPRLTQIATIYTNLTKTTYLLAYANNTLLNCKGHLWIEPIQNISSSPIGPLFQGFIYHTTFDVIGSWFNFTSGPYFYSIKLRKIDNAYEIDEIADDVASFEADVAYSLALAFVVQGALGGIVATAIFGRWKMQTVQK